MTGNQLLRFLAVRLAIALPLILIISFGVFALVHMAPGDPARALLGSRPANQATLEAIRERYNLNDPFIVQYGKWLLAALQGDLGRAIQGGRRVTAVIWDRAGLTAALTLFSTLIVVGVGVSMGALAAFRHQTAADRSIVMAGVFGVSSPPFVTGIILLYLFGVLLGWFPTYGAGSGFFGSLWHLTLPALALALSVMAIVVKITRASVLEELEKDYVTFARARGVGDARILFVYVLRNALIPVVTAAGLVVVGIIAGAIYVEVTFALPGLGSLIIDAVQKRDITVIQGTTLILSVIVILVNMLIDIVYVAIDPRISFGKVQQ